MNSFFLAHVGGISIFALIILLLIAFGENRRYLNFLLIVGLGGLAWYVVIFLLNATGYIRHFPGLFNKGLPVYYLIGPSFYLYIRGSVYPMFSWFRKADLLHLSVAVPAISAIMPYCLLDRSGQQQIVDQIASNPNYALSSSKYIVGVWHWCAWPLTTLFYNVLQLRLILRVSKKQKQTVKNLKWMYGITFICLVTFSLLFCTNLGMIFKNASGEPDLISKEMVIILYGCFLMLGVIFFINPDFIYGGAAFPKNDGLPPFFPQPTEAPGMFKNSRSMLAEVVPYEEKKFSETTVRELLPDLDIVERLEVCLTETKLYLEPGLTLSKLAVATAIPSYKLSELLNHHYKKNFNTYINTWRIEHVVKRLAAGAHKSYTLEALAEEAGFASRKSFFTAFKKEMNLSPSAYIATMLLIED